LYESPTTAPGIKVAWNGSGVLGISVLPVVLVHEIQAFTENMQAFSIIFKVASIISCYCRPDVRLSPHMSPSPLSIASAPLTDVGPPEIVVPIRANNGEIINSIWAMEYL
jgi:hypothetical protein